jgi:glucokinase
MMKYSIGIDLGGTNIKYALVAKDGNVVFSKKIATQADKSRDQVISNLEHCCIHALEYAEDNDLDVCGIGIGTPGIIDNGIVLGGAENLPEWENLPLGGILERRLGKPVFVDNDANLMGLAEVRYGEATQVNDAIFLTIGTGVGGTMVLNGQLYGGHRNRGAELGHVLIDPNGAECGCGAKGCLEAHASVTALIRDYSDELKEMNLPVPPNIDGAYITKKYHEKEEAAINAFDKHFHYLAMGIAGFINIFSPQKVLIGGGLSEAGHFYLENIRRRAMEMAMRETSVFTQIELAKLGNKAGFMGAAALVFDNLKIIKKEPCTNKE